MGYDIISNQPINMLPYQDDSCNIGDGKMYCMLVNTDDALYLHIEQTPCAGTLLCEPDFIGDTEFPLVNGSFTGSATGWTLGTGWSYGSGDIYHTPYGGGKVTQTGLSFVSGVSYDITLTITGWTQSYLWVEIGAATGFIGYMIRASPDSTQTVRITPTSNETELNIVIDSAFIGHISQVTVTESSSCWTYDTSWARTDCGLSHTIGSTTTLSQPFTSLTGNVRFVVTVENMTAGNLIVSTGNAGNIIVITQNGTYQYNDFQFSGYLDTITLTPSTDFDGCAISVDAYDLQGVPDGEVQQLAEDGNWYASSISDFLSNTQFYSQDGSMDIIIDPDTFTSGCFRFVFNDQCSDIEPLSIQMSPDIPLNNQGVWTNYNLSNSSVLVTGGAMEQEVLVNGASTSAIGATYNYPYTNGYYQIDWSLTTGDYDSYSGIGVDAISFNTPTGLGGYDPYLLVLDPLPNTAYSGTILAYIQNTWIYANKFFLNINAGSGAAGDINQITQASFIIRNQFDADANDHTYTSNTICIDDANDCTKLISGTFPTEVKQLGFWFNSNNAFRLQQRLRLIKFNPTYPIEANDYEYSSGSRSITTGKREKYYEALFDYIGETELDTLSAQILCENFTIDGVEYFVKPEDVKPEWDKNGGQKLAQVRMLLRKKTGTIYKNNI